MEAKAEKQPSRMVANGKFSLLFKPTAFTPLLEVLEECEDG